MRRVKMCAIEGLAVGNRLTKKNEKKQRPERIQIFFFESCSRDGPTRARFSQ
jgi:hypothetical protein